MIYMIFLFLVTNLAACENYVLIGPPGSGKGTYCQNLKSEGYNHICPGDIVRTHIKNKTELGENIKNIVAQGDYVDDSIIFKIIEEHVTNSVNSQAAFIIDGFPRNQEGYKFLYDLLTKLQVKNKTTFIHFIIDDDTCINRIANRLVCFKCYSIYNTKTKLPVEEMICDNCHNRLEQRLGDCEDNTKKRLHYFRKNIECLAGQAKNDYKVLNY